MRKDELEHMTRRGFLSYMGWATLRIGGVVALNIGAGMIQDARNNTTERRETQEIESQKKVLEQLNREKQKTAQETGSEPLHVKDFSSDIYSVVNRMEPMDLNRFMVGGTLGWIAGDGVLGYLFRGYSGRTNALIGSTSGVTGKLIDFGSTYFAHKAATTDPRYKEYGFEHYWTENSPYFSSHPTLSELLISGGTQTAVMGVGGFIYPMIGRAYFLLSPFIADLNTTCSRQILAALGIGDRVKDMIQDGKKIGDIELFIYAQASSREKQAAPPAD